MDLVGDLQHQEGEDGQPEHGAAETSQEVFFAARPWEYRGITDHHIDACHIYIYACIDVYMYVYIYIYIYIYMYISGFIITGYLYYSTYIYIYIYIRYSVDRNPPPVWSWSCGWVVVV